MANTATPIPGRVAILWKGAWSSSIQYLKLDYVVYKGNSYLCINNNKGVNPFNDTNNEDDKIGSSWALVADGTPD